MESSITSNENFSKPCTFLPENCIDNFAEEDVIAIERIFKTDINYERAKWCYAVDGSHLSSDTSISDSGDEYSNKVLPETVMTDDSPGTL